MRDMVAQCTVTKHAVPAPPSPTSSASEDDEDAWEQMHNPFYSPTAASSSQRRASARHASVTRLQRRVMTAAALASSGAADGRTAGEMEAAAVAAEAVVGDDDGSAPLQFAMVELEHARAGTTLSTAGSLSTSSLSTEGGGAGDGASDAESEDNMDSSRGSGSGDGGSSLDAGGLPQAVVLPAMDGDAEATWLEAQLPSVAALVAEAQAQRAAAGMSPGACGCACTLVHACLRSLPPALAACVARLCARGKHA